MFVSVTSGILTATRFALARRSNAIKRWPPRRVINYKFKMRKTILVLVVCLLSAVVVQAQVPARAAAIVFTRHPVSGRSDQLLINAAPGLGEAMVSGMITPDTIVVSKADRAVVEFTPGESDMGRALGDDAREALVALSLEVERAFGAPVDIEAALADDGWYLLQARPITTP